MTLAQIKATVRSNLSDAGVTSYTEVDLNESMQDAYDDIVILSQCITKRVTLTWQNLLSYYDFSTLGVSDYLNTIGIFNNVTNMWLRDDLSLRDFDRVRRDWENGIGSPQFWAPSSPSNVAVMPKYSSTTASAGAFFGGSSSSAYYIGSAGGLGTYILLYSATAPTFTADTDVPLIAVDVQVLLEYYVTADMLEQFEEFTKAGEFWLKYTTDIEEYAQRVKLNNRSDLLLRI